ncbi:MAG: metallophosphoesterase, partial [Gemmatimonadetes bacterium]|nr:metallophosphoesterase [Gemmatimonadota bacterium]
RIDFLLDTGDIVNDGRHTDQFARLANEILAIVPDRPYLVGVGNHEVHDNDAQARANAATFLSTVDPVLSPDRLYYRKDLGPATFLFLDTNDLVYGDDGERGECPPEIAPGTRAAAQIEWLAGELENLRAHPRPLVFAVLHHPFVQSSQKHRDAAASLWNLRVRGTSFPDFLADGGVHVILTGHTHTYERFVLTRDDGRTMHVVNLSGRPRGSAFGFGAGRRRARDIRGEEAEKLGEWGWRDLARWSVTQEDAMRKEDEANQFAAFTVEPDGGLMMEVHFVDEDEEAAIELEIRRATDDEDDDASAPRHTEPVRLR